MPNFETRPRAYARTAPMLLGVVWPTIPAALPESVSPADLVGSGRDAEAAEQLRGAVALRLFDAEAYRLLGGLLGERWERRALRTRSTDFGVRESDVPEPELRAEAVDALTSSVQLQPSAHVHAVILNLLTPNVFLAATAHDMQQAVCWLPSGEANRGRYVGRCADRGLAPAGNNC